MSEFNVMTLEEITEEATAFGCEVVRAADNELQFDLDDDDSLAQFADFYAVKLFNLYGDKLPRRHWKSKSGNDHWTITLPESKSVPERIAMQLAGGSDPGREWAALCCHWAGSKHPILLYRPVQKSLPAEVA